MPHTHTQKFENHEFYVQFGTNDFDHVFFQLLDSFPGVSDAVVFGLSNMKVLRLLLREK